MSQDDEPDWKVELQKHDEALETQQNAEATPSFSIPEFKKRMRQGEDWHKLVQAKIYLEFVALKFLEQELANPNEIRLSRMSFSSRLDLISALGLAPKNFIDAVRLVSKKRNNVAHDLEFELTEQDANEIASQLPKELKKIAREVEFITDQGPIEISQSLSIIVVMFEQYRQTRMRYLVWIKHKKHRERLLQKMIKQVIAEIST
ncbi:hypothetical protein [Marivivens donghaensis]|uniref:hypothetical protein n=1 Tax=Marivivens donghaensis TaxID=1699413 RepID=UPI00201F80AC|nr:hypothetical protein [Marivivens donghaensis]MCL7408386.1 hypothetical protein [Marivivens donghaensis]MDN3704843.1 hypothetical protein [Marivivens donghaensis]